MSLYNMLHGVNTAVVFFMLPVLGKHPDQFPRFRDAFLGDEAHPETEGKLVIYTRTGGGNREEFAKENEAMRQIEGFVMDYDDTDDSTYANFVFDIPEKWTADVDHLLNGKPELVSQAYIDNCCAVFPKIDDKIRATFARHKGEAA